MANHYRVSPKFWPKARKRGWSDQQTTLALYLLTCDHRNLEGLYRLPKPYIGADLGWPARKVEEALASVCASGFAQYDETAEVVLIPKALKHQSPSTPNQIKGAMAQLERIPRTSLWDAFRIACASHCPKLANAIAERWPSDASGISRAHESAPAPASSSSSTSSSNSISTSSASASSSAVAAEPEESREDVARLCHLLANLIVGNDPKAKVAPDSKGWQDACRLLLDRDGRTESDVATVIRWCQADTFWLGNILSMPKLREKYAQLLLKMQTTTRRAGGTDDPWSTENILAAGRGAA